MNGFHEICLCGECGKGCLGNFILILMYPSQLTPIRLRRPLPPCLHGVSLRHRGNFTFRFTVSRYMLIICNAQLIKHLAQHEEAYSERNGAALMLYAHIQVVLGSSLVRNPGYHG
jgi:hypothetical protein